jgi:hypothetical protein
MDAGCAVRHGASRIGGRSALNDQDVFVKWPTAAATSMITPTAANTAPINLVSMT